MEKDRIYGFLSAASSAAKKYWPAGILLPALIGAFLIKSDISSSSANQPYKVEISLETLPTILNSESPVPSILSDADRDSYTKIFTLQHSGDFAGADQEIKQVKDKILLGHILADRYLQNGYKATAPEIKSWLENYGDLSEADRIYTKGKNLGFAEDYKPASKVLKGYGENNGLSARVENSISAIHWGNRTKAAQAWKHFADLVKDEYLTKAAQVLESQKVQLVWKPYEQDIAKWSLASAHFAEGHDKEAYRLAKEAADRSGSDIPGVYWTAGITAWRLGDVENATKNFSYLAKVKGISGWEQSAAAFWAYRGYLQQGNKSDAKQMLKMAAENRYTFYGLLARRAMNQSPDFEWKKEALTASDLHYLASIPAVARAIALVEVGFDYDAENELRKYYPTASSEDKGKLLALADRMKMPGLQVRIAGMMRQEQGQHNDYANYPVPGWKPAGGYKVEPALIFALMRHESGFNPNAESSVGAVGLMQIMPETAAYLAGKENSEFKPDDLYTPERNIGLAQNYVQQLLSRADINGNLFFLAAAYNAGPGKLSEWAEKIDYKNDPLLFMESIHSRETRGFVEQVVANYWIYCKRLEGDSKTMDMVLANNWPVYGGSAGKAGVYLAQLSGR